MPIEFSINHIRTPEDQKNGPVKIGWLFDEPKSSVVYFAPEKLRTTEVNKEHVKSASRCPAIINLESRYALVRCPFDMHIAFERDKSGKPVLRNCLGAKSPVRPSKLDQLLSLTAENEWRHPNRPIIQLKLPYLFVSDEPVYLSQVPPFMHFQKNNPLPGTLFGGRFPIDVWPRPLMWAFEWHDLETEIKLKRGQPLFYCQFETDSPERSIQLFEAERTPELSEYLELISGAVNYVNQTFALFKQAKERRPEFLVTKKSTMSLL